MKPSLSLAYAIKRRSKTATPAAVPLDVDAELSKLDDEGIDDAALDAADDVDDGDYELLPDEPVDKPSPIAQIMSRIRRSKMSTPDEA